MSFAITIGPSVIERQLGLPDELIELLEKSIEKFSKNPKGLSRETAPMLNWDGPIFTDIINFEGRRHVLTVFFSFGPGENEVSITDFTLMPPYPKPGEVDRCDPFRVRGPITEIPSS